MIGAASTAIKSTRYCVELLQKYPGLFRHMIVMDVPATIELTSIKAKWWFLNYQLYLIIAFLIGGSIGERMTKRFSKASGNVPKYFDEIKPIVTFPTTTSGAALFSLPSEKRIQPAARIVRVSP